MWIKKDVNNCFALEEYRHCAAAALPGWVSVKTCTEDLCPVQQRDLGVPMSQRERETWGLDEQGLTWGLTGWVSCCWKFARIYHSPELMWATPKKKKKKLQLLVSSCFN